MTALFVPGDRADRYAKAAASGADLVIIDLEDAVAPPDKADARSAVVAALSPGTGLQALVRINDPDTDGGRRRSRRPGRSRPAGPVMASARRRWCPRLVGRRRSVAVVTQLDRRATGSWWRWSSPPSASPKRTRLAALPGVTRLAFGAIDFALDVAAEVDAFTGAGARAAAGHRLAGRRPCRRRWSHRPPI